MSPHKIITKRSINSDLKNLNGKIVLFVDKKGNFNKKYFHLKNKVLEDIKKITCSEKVKNLGISEGITTTNWIDTLPFDFLIVKMEKNLTNHELDTIAKLISDFKGKSKVSILWDLEQSPERVARESLDHLLADRPFHVPDIRMRLGFGLLAQLPGRIQRPLARRIFDRAQRLVERPPKT